MSNGYLQDDIVQLAALTPDTPRTAAKKAEDERRQAEQFRARQISLTKMFHRYRQGANHKTPLAYEGFPRYANAADVDHEFLKSDDIALEPYRGNRFLPARRRGLRDITNQEKRRYSRRRINVVSRQLFRLGIRFRRIIACGGMGMAALFEVQNRATGLFNKVVAKIALSERHNGALKQEKKFLKMLKNDPHILQIKTVDELRSMTGGYPAHPSGERWPDDPSLLPEPSPNQIRLADEDPGIMLTEYLPFGPLDHWISKAVELHQHFSTEALWRMMLCLAKACATMKCPPVQDGQTERQLTDIVHFDLDPTNVLVDAVQMIAHANAHYSEMYNEADRTWLGDMMSGGALLSERSDVSMVDAGDDDDDDDDGGAPLQPRQPSQCTHDRSLHLKVADFGIAAAMDVEVLGDHEQLWNMRRRGKFRYYAPEQWTAEWDAVHANPLLEKKLIAGAYSSKTNIYQVGMLMVAMMTRMRPEPCPRMHAVLVDDFGHAGHQYLDQAPAVYSSVPFRILYTSSWVVKQPPFAERYELSLRELVMRMTSYSPGDRPSPEELVAIIEKRIDHGFADTGRDLPRESDWVGADKMPMEPQPEKGYSQAAGAVDSNDTVLEPENENGEGGDRVVHNLEDVPGRDAQRLPQPAPELDAAFAQQFRDAHGEVPTAFMHPTFWGGARQPPAFFPDDENSDGNK